MPGCQGTPCSKQARNLNFKCLLLDSNPEPLSSETNTQPFGQTDQFGYLDSLLFGQFDQMVECSFLN